MLENINAIVDASGDVEDDTLELWRCWKKINPLLQHTGRLGDTEIASFKSAVEKFGKVFVERYTGLDVTPYIHILVKHAPYILEKHKTLGMFANQGFEGLNKYQRTIYITGTNHGGGKKKEPLHHPAVKQMLLKNWRLLEYEYGMPVMTEEQEKEWEKDAPLQLSTDLSAQMEELRQSLARDNPPPAPPPPTLHTSTAEKKEAKNKKRKLEESQARDSSKQTQQYATLTSFNIKNSRVRSMTAATKFRRVEK